MRSWGYLRRVTRGRPAGGPQGGFSAFEPYGEETCSKYARSTLLGAGRAARTRAVTLLRELRVEGLAA